MGLTGRREHREAVMVTASAPSLPDDATKRLEYPMADGLLDYFPNALAEVSRLSHAATKQHHPDKPMHWDRSKSTDHRSKIMRHLVDAGRSEEHTSELQSLMRISYAVFCLKKKNKTATTHTDRT